MTWLATHLVKPLIQINCSKLNLIKIQMFYTIKSSTDITDQMGNGHRLLPSQVLMAV